VQATVAVVVATYNRSALLPRLMEALASQREAPPFEVIVVDDASSDETPNVLATLSSSAPFPLTVLRQPENRGPACGRNRGWRASSAALICFTDDDCVPSATWLSQMVEALSECDLAQGCTLPNPDQRANWGPFSHTLDVRSESGHYETANMAYRREVLDRTGGFDESFKYAYGEDCELAWRAKQGGATSRFLEQAIVYHDITPSSWRSALRGRQRLEGMVQVVQRQPAIRRQLGIGLFLERRHAHALAVAAAGAALAASPSARRRWAAAGATALWYAWDCRRSRMGPAIGPIGWIAVVPGAFVVDLAAVAVLARASVRHRTLLL